MMATQKSKPIILTLVRYYLPGFRAGGPIRSVANLAECLSDQFEFKIIAGDRDLGDTEAFRNAGSGTWVKTRAVQVRYVPTDLRAAASIACAIRNTPHDILYLNSFFDPLFSLWPLLIRRLSDPTIPVVLAPRGEFSPGALRIKSWKKIPFVAFMRRASIHRGVIWQASSHLEAHNIVEAMGSSYVTGDTSGAIVAPDITSPGPAELGISRPLNIVIAPNVPGGGPGGERSTQSAGGVESDPLRICFLSRISPMKNLDYALKVLVKVKIPVRFAIYGPVEDVAYWEACNRLIGTLPQHIQATYLGIVEPQNVVATFAQHDLFLFPTKGENFGHVIHESLRAGTPALLSDQTSWSGLDSRGIGACLPLNSPEEFVRVIEDMAMWTADKRAGVREAARLYADMIDVNSGAVQANRRLFGSALRFLEGTGEAFRNRQTS